MTEVIPSIMTSRQQEGQLAGVSGSRWESGLCDPVLKFEQMGKFPMLSSPTGRLLMA